MRGYLRSSLRVLAEISDLPLGVQLGHTLKIVIFLDSNGLRICSFRRDAVEHELRTAGYAGDFSGWDRIASQIRVILTVCHREDEVMKMNIVFAVLLISLLAVGAYAQTESEPVKDQTRENGSENAANPGTGDANQNYTEYENEKPAEPHDPTGPAGAEAEGSAHQGTKVLDAEKDGDQTQNYGEGDGNNYELGENRRHGDEYAGEGGPNGPVGPGPVETFLKMFGLEEAFGFVEESGFGGNADGAFAGEMLQHSWGPGTSTLDGPFGPNDGVGFGPGGDGDGAGDPAGTSSPVQTRSGRR